MRTKLWITLSLVIAVLTAALALPVGGAQPAAHAQSSGGSAVIFLKDGDIWRWDGTALTQLTTWGYNEQPVMAPNGSQIAYNSWAQITVEAIAAGRPVLGFIPSNIWVLNPATGDAFRAADQPPNAVFAQDGAQDIGVMRSTPTWSPDSAQLAWVELLVPEYRYQLVVYTLATGQSQVIVSDLPAPYGDGGIIPMLQPRWGAGGIAIVNAAYSDTAQDFQETLYIFSSSGAPRAQAVLGSANTEFAFWSDWVSFNGGAFYGVLYSSGKRYLVDPATGQFQDMPALPEMVSGLAQPTGTASVYAAPNTDPNNQLTNIWTAVYPNRAQESRLDYTGLPRSIAVATEGTRVAYFTNALYIWQNGSATMVPGTAGDGSLFDFAVAWGPKTWRVRTDFGGGIPAPTCGPAPRLTPGTAGQVLPGLPNVIRSLPRRGPDSAILGEIPGGGIFAVNGGPECGPEGRYWWPVDYQGITGWTPEGQGSTYWTQPYEASPPPVACTLPPRLTVGTAGYVLPGLPNVVRSQPRRGTDSPILGRIPGGTYFAVTGGPQCGPEGRYWWQVDYQGLTGWTAEGENGVYWVAPFGCPASPPTRLGTGMQARVTTFTSTPNRLRTGPGTNYPEASLIPAGGVVTVLGGPQCGPEGWTYWRVNYNGQIGWTAEGDGSDYWLEPYTAPPPQVCGPAPRLLINVGARVLPGTPNVIRSQPRRGADSAILGEIPGGGFVTVLNGPQCGPEGRYWWLVQYGNVVGWTPEGQGSTYWVEPWPGDGPGTGPVTCSPTPRLDALQTGQVLPGTPNVIRSAPGTGADSAVIGQIPGNGFFFTTGGPVCGGDGRYWWPVRYQGQTGWTAEGEGSTYWTTPVQCAGGPRARLIAGMTGRVLPGLPNVIRSAPGTGADSAVIGQIPGGASFSVLAGPVCGNDGRAWYQVQSASGTGWTAEGEGGTYWLEPVL